MSQHPQPPGSAYLESLTCEDFLALPHEPPDGLEATRRGHIQASRIGQVDLLTLTHDGAVAVISLLGAQVLAYRPAGGTDVLFTSATADFSGIQAIRGGVPICWPWFNTAASPKHGWGRTAVWTVLSTEASDDASRAQFALSTHGAQAQVSVTLGRELTITLTHIADPMHDAAPKHTSAALHSYFLVSEAVGTHVDLGNDQPFEFPAGGIDTISPLHGKEEKELRITSEGSAAVTVTTDASDAVLWNPAADMPDLLPGGFARYVCVEPARISSPLQPGQSLSATISQSGADAG